MESTYHAPRSKFPAPPDRDIVDSLMQMINLVEDKRTRPKARTGGGVPIRPKSVTTKALKKKAVKKKAKKKK